MEERNKEEVLALIKNYDILRVYVKLDFRILLKNKKRSKENKFSEKIPDQISIINSCSDNAVLENNKIHLNRIDLINVECSFGERFYKELFIIKEKKVRSAYINFSPDFHLSAKKSTELVESAKEQEDYFEKNNLIFEKRVKWKIRAFSESAKKLNLNTKKFNELPTSEKCKERVEKEVRESQNEEVFEKQTFFIDEKKLLVRKLEYSNRLSKKN
ncbi:MAG: thioredoxin domain-containing protein [Candidatus Pacearchaeota archaeon]